MELLPRSAERTALLSALRTLIARRGYGTFLKTPLVEPTPEWFPDRWEPTTAGVERLARRILALAGLERLRARVELYRNPEEIRAVDAHGRPSAWGHTGAAAWFAGIHDGVCHFGAERGGLADAAHVVAAMCHEVAHAYRERHGLVIDDDHEERRTDLTTVYLGFGVLTTNGSYRYRASSGADLSSRSSHQQLGYLPPESMAFLLAAQVVARRMDAGGRSHVARLLEPNQRASFRAACEVHDEAGMGLPLELGLPGDGWLTPEPRRSWWRRLLRR
jgi:hypothetical protein